VTAGSRPASGTLIVLGESVTGNLRFDYDCAIFPFPSRPVSIELEWWRDTHGYCLVDEEAPKKPPLGASLLTQAAAAFGEPQRVVRLGGTLLPYRPLADFGDVLFREFANASRDPHGVLGFIERFGPLTPDGLDAARGEEVPRLIQHAEAMHDWLDACRNDNRAALPRMVGPEGINLSSIRAVLTVDPITQAPRIRLTVNSLLAGLWLQLGQALSKGATIQQCRHCGKMFETGPGTSRRLDAKFCSDDHRIAFNSLNRSKGRRLNA
jgi:hypothetical protein